MNLNRYFREAVGICGLLFLGVFQLIAHPKGTSLTGPQVDLFGDASKDVVVVLFVAVECPISNRFAPAVNRIYDTFNSDDFAMWTVYTDDLFTLEEIAKHRSDYQYQMPALVDFERKLAKHCGANVTPEAVVYVRDHSDRYRMIYRGRVNNQYVDFGKWRLEPTKEDLLEVLTEVRENGIDDIEFQETKAIGCYIGE